MKKILFSLAALIFASSAWGEGVKPPAKSDIPKGVSVKISGSADGIAKLVASLKASPVYKAAKCGDPAAVGEETIINCTKDTKRLEDFLKKNASKDVKVGIEHDGKLLCNGNSGCYIMSCPPPVGPVMCCHTGPYSSC